jgi:hypothetical protein
MKVRMDKILVLIIFEGFDELPQESGKINDDNPLHLFTHKERNDLLDKF